jgi:hypothetical protein
VPILLDGLKRLEYRGYDSAGLAVLEQGRMVVHRSVGKIKELENAVWGATWSGRSVSDIPAGRRTGGPRRRTPTRTRTAPATWS